MNIADFTDNHSTKDITDASDSGDKLVGLMKQLRDLLFKFRELIFEKRNLLNELLDLKRKSI